MYTYHANGKTAVIQKYIPGSTNSTWTEYDANGYLVISGYLKNERRHGAWCVFYTNGKQHSCTPYKDGVIQGIYTRWYPNGKKMLEYDIDVNGQVVKATGWSEQGKVLNKGSKEFKEIFDSNLPGSMFTDLRDFNRNVVDRVVDDGRIGRDAEEIGVPTTEWNPGVEEYLRDLDLKAADSNQVYSFCQIMPEFPGGWDSMGAYVRRNTIYPKGSEAFGTVYVSYVVEKNGAVTNAKKVCTVKEEESWPPYKLAADHPLVASFIAAASDAHGRSLTSFVCGPSNIGCYLSALEVPATCGFGVNFRGLHAADEAIEIASILPVVNSYRKLVENLLYKPDVEESSDAGSCCGGNACVNDTEAKKE